jgi:hypothetical protein
MVNNVIGVVNYVIAARPSLLNFMIADSRMRSVPDHAVIDGQVNRDASPDTESVRASLKRMPGPAACRWRGVFRVGARAGPAPTAAHAVPDLLAEQDSPRGVQWL